MCIRNAVEQVCYLVPPPPSWAPTIVTCKAEDQTVTAPSSPVMPPPKFRTPSNKNVGYGITGLLADPGGAGWLAPHPAAGSPGDWGATKPLNHKLRRVRSAGW
jgi:hypothetical protein